MTPDDDLPATAPRDDRTPTWEERGAGKARLASLTYAYFERARRDDAARRRDATYVERDVVGAPGWPHEAFRNLAIATFYVGIIVLLAAAFPPHLAPPANPSQTPSVILPDWYLYWSFGLLKLAPLNPELAVLGGEKLMSDQTAGVVANLLLVALLAAVPFVNRGPARRPVEEPFWAAVGVAGIVFLVAVSALSIKNLVPMSPHLLFDLTFVLPAVVGSVVYAVLRTFREGYMYRLNRQYYRLREPR